MRVAALLFACAGCSQVFGLETPSRSDASSIDSTPDATPTCYGDRFNGAELNPLLWDLINTTGDIAVDSGVLRVTPVAGMTGYVGIQARWPLAFVDTSYDVELVQIASGAGMTTYFELNFGPQMIIAFAANATTLRAGLLSSTTASSPYDPQAHRFLRMHFETATPEITFQTSPDAAVWTEVARAAIPQSMTSVTLRLLTLEEPQSAAPGVAIFDNVIMRTPGCIP